MILALLPLMSVGLVHAQSDGLGISPRKDYTISPGSTKTDTLYLSDLSQKEALQVTIRVVDFKAQNESGTPSLLLASNAPTTTWSLKPFIHIPSSVTVAAGQSINIPYTISIPANQGAGSYYSAIEYTAQNVSSQSAVTVAASSATLVFVTVPGQAHELLSFENFGTFVPNLITGLGNYKSLFIGSQPLELAYTLQNNGDVAENPQGSITIDNMFGSRVRVIQKANSRSSLALIGQTRLFESCIVSGEQSTYNSGVVTTQSVCKSPNLFPGYYTTKLDVLYGINGNNSQEVTANASFWYIPWWSLVAVVVFVGALIVVARYIYVEKEKRHDSPDSKNSSSS